jgi:hypothetical protein
VIVDGARLHRIEARKRIVRLHGLRVRIGNLPEGEEDVRRAYRLTVGERGFLVELETVRQPVIGDVPRIRETGDRLQVLIEIDERREEVVRDVTVVPRAENDRIERGDVQRKPPNEHPAVLRRVIDHRTLSRRGNRLLAIPARHKAEEQ